MVDDDGRRGPANGLPKNLSGPDLGGVHGATRDIHDIDHLILRREQQRAELLLLRETLTTWFWIELSLKLCLRWIAASLVNRISVLF